MDSHSESQYALQIRRLSYTLHLKAFKPKNTKVSHRTPEVPETMDATQRYPRIGYYSQILDKGKPLNKIKKAQIPSNTGEVQRSNLKQPTPSTGSQQIDLLDHPETKSCTNSNQTHGPLQIMQNERELPREIDSSSGSKRKKTSPFRYPSAPIPRLLSLSLSRGGVKLVSEFKHLLFLSIQSIEATRETRFPFYHLSLS